MQVYDSILQAPVGNFIAQPCENENQCLESLPEFLRGNRTELYFPSKFSKSLRSKQSKIELLGRDLVYVEPQNTKNTAEVNAKNECLTIIKQKCCQKFYRF